MPGFFFAQGRSGSLDVGRLLSLWALNDLEADLLAFLEGLETGHVDRGEVRKQIIAAVVWSDKTKTLCIVEPFNNSGCHFTIPFKENIENPGQANPGPPHQRINATTLPRNHLMDFRIAAAMGYAPHLPMRAHPTSPGAPLCRDSASICHLPRNECALDHIREANGRGR